MKLSTKGRYGTRVLLELALRFGAGPVPLKDIARSQEISLQYLEHLINPLTAAGIIRSTRGARGGVWLAKPPQEVKLDEVIGLLEGSLAPVQCVDDPDFCPRSKTCVTRDVWGELKIAMTEILEGITLQDMVERQKRKQQKPTVTMYYI